MNHDEKRRPKNRRSDGKVILDVTSSRVLVRAQVAARIQAPSRKRGVRCLPVFFKVQVVVDQQAPERKRSNRLRRRGPTD